jgi:hypothetical protein
MGARAQAVSAAPAALIAVLGGAQLGCRQVLGIEELLPQETAPSACGDTAWSLRFDGDYALNGSWIVAADSDGDALIAGTFEGTIDVGGAGEPLVSASAGDMLLAKIDPKGAPMWSRRFGGAAGDTIAPYTITADPSGGVIVGGQLRGSVDLGGTACTGAAAGFIAAYDPSGEPRWSYCMSPTGGALAGALIGGLRVSAGEVLVSGAFSGSVELAGQSLVTAENAQESFVVRFDIETGAPIEVYVIGAGGGVSQPVLTADGDMIVCGNSYNTANVLGEQEITSVGGSDAYVVRFGYTPEVDLSWVTRLGVRSNEYCNALSVDDAGNILAAGYFFPTFTDVGGGPLAPLPGCGGDDFLLMLHPDGVHASSRAVNVGCSGETFFGVDAAFDSSGNAVVAGAFFGELGGFPLESSGDTDVFLAKYDASLKPICSRSFGGPSRDIATDMALDPAGNVLLIGTFHQQIDFGAGPLTDAQGNGASRPTIFLAKLAPP